DRGARAPSSCRVPSGARPSWPRPGRAPGAASPRAGAARRASSPREALQLGDDLLHHLVGAAPDPEEPVVAIRARDRALVHVPVAAVHLEAAVNDGARHFAGEELAHRDLLRDVLAGVEPVRTFVDERAQRGEVREHFDEPMLIDLEGGDRPPEYAALPRVFL